MRAIEFPAGPSPRVSILILAWRQPVLLESCLRAIVETCGNTVAYEVIVVLNDATPQVEDFLRSNVRGARLVHSRVNLGFAGGNNRAASEARGEYLVLLNDDTSVEPGWLDWLVATADANPRAGAVGSTILFSDGRICRKPVRFSGTTARQCPSGAVMRVIPWNGNSCDGSTIHPPARCSCAGRCGKTSAASTRNTSPPITKTSICVWASGSSAWTSSTNRDRGCATTNRRAPTSASRDFSSRATNGGWRRNGVPSSISRNLQRRRRRRPSRAQSGARGAAQADSCRRRPVAGPIDGRRIRTHVRCARRAVGRRVRADAVPDCEGGSAP